MPHSCCIQIESVLDRRQTGERANDDGGGFLARICCVVLLASTGCGGGGVATDCGEARCAALGKNCGEVVVDDCGAMWCGDCQAPESCAGGGTPNVCGRENCTPSWQCEQPLNGSEQDGCGNRRGNPVCDAQPSCGNGVLDSGETCDRKDNAGCTAPQPTCRPDCRGCVATAFYVSLSGNDGNDGLSPKTAWRTMTYAATRAAPGDAVFVEGGDYGHEHVVFNRSGAAGTPIVFEGYAGTPVIDGEDSSGNGLHIRYAGYIQIKNVEVRRYSYGIFLDNASHVVLDKTVVIDWGTDRTRETMMQFGVFFLKSESSELRDCSVTDARYNVELRYSSYNLVDNCTVVGLREFSDAGEDLGAGYYVVVGYGHDNVVQNSFAQNKHAAVEGTHGGHGFVVKDNPTWEGSAPHSQDNQFVNCTSRGMAESFVSSHKAHDNRFLGCENYRDDL